MICVIEMLYHFITWFSIIEHIVKFIKKCYEYNKPFALLLPLTSLEGINRGKMYRENGIELLVFDRRCNFIYNNVKKSNWFNTSWFCHNVLPNKLIFEELNKEE